ncbi:MAG: hypothetical protein M9957_07670 [Rhodobacteraceae bacterium]|nr:hypothetical protein [Paracoccaceae bacterium]
MASRGGLIGMALAATSRDRLSGLCLNDIGPVIERGGLDRICDYVGRNPAARTIDDLAARMPRTMPGFDGVSPERWTDFARQLYEETETGLAIRLTRRCGKASWPGTGRRSPTYGRCSTPARACPWR